MVAKSRNLVGSTREHMMGRDDWVEPTGRTDCGPRWPAVGRGDWVEVTVGRGDRRPSKAWYHPYQRKPRPQPSTPDCSISGRFVSNPLSLETISDYSEPLNSPRSQIAIPYSPGSEIAVIHFGIRTTQSDIFLVMKCKIKFFSSRVSQVQVKLGVIVMDNRQFWHC